MIASLPVLSGHSRLKTFLLDWSLPLAALLILSASLAWDTWQSYRRNLDQEYRYLESHARIADAQLSGALRMLDVTLREVAGERLASPARNPIAFSKMLAQRAARFPEMRFLMTADKSGRVQAISDPKFIGFDASKREYFTQPRDAADPERSFVSRPFTAANGATVVAISRAIRDGKGNFMGVVAASIAPKYFESVLQAIKPEGSGHALLVNMQGDVLYDVPQPELTGKSLKGGIAFEAHLAAGDRSTRHLNISKLLGIKRVSVLRRIDEPSLIVFVSRDYDEVLLAWRYSAITRASIFLLAVIVMLYLATLARRHRRRLARAEENLRRLVASSPLPMLVTEGEQQRVIFFNRRFSELIGYSLDEVPDVSHWWPLAYPDPAYREWVMRLWAQRFEQAQLADTPVEPVEASVRCKNGEERIFEVHLSRIGRLSLVVFADLTERRRAEAELRESEARLRKAQEVAHVGSWNLDMQRGQLVWTEEAYRIFGIAPGTPLTYELFLGRVHPEDRDAVDKAWTAALSGAPYDIEHRIVVDGKEFWVHERAEITFGASGQAVRGTGTVQDITDRKQADLQLRLAATVFEHSREGVTITDLDRNIISVNRAFTEITGYAQEEALGRNPRMLQSGRQNQAFYRAMWDSINKHGYWSGEIWNRRKNGEAYPELLSISVVTDRLGKPLHYIGVFTDISELKRSADEIRQLNADLEKRVRERTAELENSNRELESFSYSVSHDLRAPLRAIDGFSHVIADEYGQALGEDGRTYLQRIRTASQKMGTLIDNLLDLAQVSRHELKRARTDLSSLVEEAARELAEAEPRRKMEWRIQKGIVAQGDPVLLKVAMDNLLRNAWKFTASVAAPCIEFGVTTPDGAPVYFVRDNGAGIDMTYADKLFKPFQRLHDPKQFEGTGIGLAIVHRVIRRHGGSIRVESTPGQGAAFFFTLG